jgi:exodeoxyribonuclease VII small subunit
MMGREKSGRKKPFAFERAMTRLTAIVAGLESGEQSLEESLKDFEEGVGLVKQCRAYLESSRQRVEVLLGEEDGRPVLDTLEEDVDEDDEDDESEAEDDAGDESDDEEKAD